MSDAYDARPWTALYPPDIPPDLPLPTRTPLQLFEAATSSGPDRPCLHYFTQTLTFAEVDRASDALAAALVASGFGPGDRIGLFLQNVPQFVIAQLAGWKVAGIVVSLSPMLKGKELGHHLADAGCRVLVAQDDLYADVAASIVADSPVQLTITTNAADLLGAAEVPASLPVRRPVAAGTQDWRALIERYDGQRAPRPSTGLDDVAYLVYTSGTTGRPKGAMITHANLAFNTEALCRLFALTERLNDTIEPLARDRGLTLLTPRPDGMSSIRTDADKLEQILLNLLINAVKYTDVGEVELTITPGGEGEVRFAVRDTGQRHLP